VVVLVVLTILVVLVVEEVVVAFELGLFLAFVWADALFGSL